MERLVDDFGRYTDAGRRVSRDAEALFRPVLERLYGQHPRSEIYHVLTDTLGVEMAHLYLTRKYEPVYGYTEPIPEYGTLMPVEEFREAVEGQLFIDYDGHGYPVKDGWCSKQVISPSTIHQLPKDATHVVWFNR